MTQMPWLQRSSEDVRTFLPLYMSTQTHQAQTEARTPQKQTLSYCNPQVYRSSPVVQTLSSVIGWLLFKLCWRTGKARSGCRSLPSASE